MQRRTWKCRLFWVKASSVYGGFEDKNEEYLPEHSLYSVQWCGDISPGSYRPTKLGCKFWKVKSFNQKNILESFISPLCREAPSTQLNCLHFYVSFISSVSNLLHSAWGITFKIDNSAPKLRSFSSLVKYLSRKDCQNFSYHHCGASKALHQIHHKTILDIFYFHYTDI